ncbi:MAG: EcsC family protein [Oligoflexus sp.]
MKRQLTNSEVQFIKDAALFLENPNLLIRLANLIGQPMDILQKSLPPIVKNQLTQVIESSLNIALKLALRTLPEKSSPPEDWQQTLQQIQYSFWGHTAMTAASGAVGGWVGIAALPIELPISTSLILRSILNTAREWGHDLHDPQIQMECLFIFTLGSDKSHADDEMDEAYLTTRIACAQLIRDAASFITQHSSKQLFKALDQHSAPIIVSFLNKIASYFQVSVSRKVMSTAVPVVGSVSGAAINAAFCDYFTAAARYHFGLKHLEKIHDPSFIQNLYRQALRGQLIVLDGAS